MSGKNIKKKNEEYFPELQTFWVCFDESNGNKGAHRYAWWFDTEKQAKEFLKEHKKRKFHSKLSKPIEVLLVER